MNTLFFFTSVSVSLTVAAKEPVNAQVLSRFQAAQEVVYFPAVNIETEVEIGQTMVSKARLLAHPTLVVSGDLTLKIESGFFSNNWSGTAFIPKGVYEAHFTSADGVFYRAMNSTFSFAAGTVQQDGGAYVPHDPTAPSLPWTLSKSVVYFGNMPVTGTVTDIKSFEADSFKRELVYGGISQGTIAVTYREFLDKTARPAFTQELKYDLSAGDVIGFRGARFKIIKAGNVTLRYIVLRQLD